MENATKALLIAAGMLLAIMIISTIIVFWDEMAGYFSERHNATILQQTVEFNNKFQNYDGKTIRGNELISIMNGIIDYNNYQSGIEGYDRVIITIDLQNHEENLKWSGDPNINLIPNHITNEGDVNDGTIKNISELSATLAKDYGLNDVELQKMSSNISYIVDADDDNEKEYRDKLLNKIVSNYDSNNMVYYIDATYKYYQLTQFKRAMFKCTSVTYDQDTGRVNGMKFEVVTEIDQMTSEEKIKFE